MALLQNLDPSKFFSYIMVTDLSDTTLLPRHPWQPDEVDALLSRRGDSENDAMRRLKNEFLQSFDGVSNIALSCSTTND